MVKATGQARLAGSGHFRQGVVFVLGVLIILALAGHIHAADFVFEPPSALNTSAEMDLGDDWYPNVMTDGSGNWIAVWANDEANIGNGIGTDDDILFAISPITTARNWRRLP